MRSSSYLPLLSLDSPKARRHGEQDEPRWKIAGILSQLGLADLTSRQLRQGRQTGEGFDDLATPDQERARQGAVERAQERRGSVARLEGGPMREAEGEKLFLG